MLLPKLLHHHCVFPQEEMAGGPPSTLFQPRRTFRQCHLHYRRNLVHLRKRLAIVPVLSARHSSTYELLGGCSSHPHCFVQC